MTISKNEYDLINLALDGEFFPHMNRFVFENFLQTQVKLNKDWNYIITFNNIDKEIMINQDTKDLLEKSIIEKYRQKLEISSNEHLQLSSLDQDKLKSRMKKLLNHNNIEFNILDSNQVLIYEKHDFINYEYVNTIMPLEKNNHMYHGFIQLSQNIICDENKKIIKKKEHGKKIYPHTYKHYIYIKDFLAFEGLSKKIKNKIISEDLQDFLEKDTFDLLLKNTNNERLKAHLENILMMNKIGDEKETNKIFKSLKKI